jgi:hypothetical protein
MSNTFQETVSGEMMGGALASLEEVGKTLALLSIANWPPAMLEKLEAAAQANKLAHAELTLLFRMNDPVLRSIGTPPGVSP